MAVKQGDIVSVHYTGRLKDGTVFDSSIEKTAKQHNVYNPKRDYVPLEFKVGAGQLIKGFEEGVEGMETGDKKEVEIPPEDAYGKSGDHPLAGKTLIFMLELKSIR
ncbi:MAG: FKBP-type peptidyl-prolyl cis-trans isomerase [Thermoplasmata archaeon]